MVSGYNSIAAVYDNINSEIDYSAWADFIESCFGKFMHSKPEIVLDLACGTGSMTFELNTRGYDMIGADMSEDMLSEAYTKACENGINDILFINQDMRCFELYGTVGAVCCCLDSINYLTSNKELTECFSCVHNYLDPNGLFIFDVNTPYKFESIYGTNHYIFETESSDGRTSYCGWQNAYDCDTKLCNFYLSVFTEESDRRFSRTDEVQTERCYSQEELSQELQKCGFDIVGFYGDYEFSAPDTNCERWYVIARAKK